MRCHTKWGRVLFRAPAQPQVRARIRRLFQPHQAPARRPDGLLRLVYDGTVGAARTPRGRAFIQMLLANSTPVFFALLFAFVTTRDDSDSACEDGGPCFRHLSLLGGTLQRALQLCSHLFEDFRTELGDSCARILFPRQAAHACVVKRAETAPEQVTITALKDVRVIVLAFCLPYVVSMGLDGAESVGIRARAAWQHGRRAHGTDDVDPEACALASPDKSAVTRLWDTFRALLFVCLERAAVGVLMAAVLTVCDPFLSMLASTIWTKLAECAFSSVLYGIGMRRRLSLLVRA